MDNYDFLNVSIFWNPQIPDFQIDRTNVILS